MIKINIKKFIFIFTLILFNFSYAESNTEKAMDLIIEKTVNIPDKTYSKCIGIEKEFDNYRVFFKKYKTSSVLADKAIDNFIKATFTNISEDSHTINKTIQNLTSLETQLDHIIYHHYNEISKENLEHLKEVKGKLIHDRNYYNLFADFLFSASIYSKM